MSSPSIIDRDPWAPWTALAARIRGDRAVVERVERDLIASVGEHGAVTGPGGREVARTAVVVEALSPFGLRTTMRAAPAA